MQAPELNRICDLYKLTPIEVSCILLYFMYNNKNLAFQNTINYRGKAKSIDVLANQFFRRDSVQRFISDQQNNFIHNNDQEEKKEVKKEVKIIDSPPPPPIMIQSPIKQEETKIKIADKYGIIDDINKENIKSIYINELNNSDNPEKRADLILKLSDKLELFAAVEENLSKPTIYLPERPE
jgi:hypothetical protein